MAIHEGSSFQSNGLRCDSRLANALNLYREDHCHLEPRQRCSTCEAALCDLHAEFCSICLAFFCEGCLDLHNEAGDHADGSIGELAARVVDGVQP
jgi:hypothetical protein